MVYSILSPGFHNSSSFSPDSTHVTARVCFILLSTLLLVVSLLKEHAAPEITECSTGRSHSHPAAITGGLLGISADQHALSSTGSFI